ncbi:hypothetical protein AB0H42_02175 [Nocardia sp. NPDC050799]|uniref:hypothetical protein n=1 Tax=Nocardia sp. NPDC050799 TaxID=3154842 RepID=UPI0034027AEC
MQRVCDHGLDAEPLGGPRGHENLTAPAGYAATPGQPAREFFAEHYALAGTVRPELHG